MPKTLLAPPPLLWPSGWLDRVTNRRSVSRTHEGAGDSKSPRIARTVLYVCGCTTTFHIQFNAETSELSEVCKLTVFHFQALVLIAYPLQAFFDWASILLVGGTISK